MAVEVYNEIFETSESLCNPYHSHMWFKKLDYTEQKINNKNLLLCCLPNYLSKYSGT